jgi:DNA helicase II / ATP-dependent DNA helicase PcrA
MSTLQATPTQLTAIQHIHGPIRVLAGPGTGKTEILALRIAQMLNSDAQIDPSNILCLTFTDAARLNMRQRLSKKIGPDSAQKISIHTYHSFCSEIISQNAEYFRRNELQMISELESISVIQNILDKVGKNSPLYNPKEPYKYAGQLKYLFEKIKQENLSVAYICNKIDEYIQSDIIDNPAMYYTKAIGNAKKGDPKGELQKKLLSAARNRAAVELLPLYKEELLQRGRYDFSDMIHWVLDLFTEQQDVLADCAERYQYIMVDEYQDTNGSQNKLIQLLADTEPDGKPNLFVVGDDDQSIYRFQGASSANMRMVEHKYGAYLKDVQLQDNFRSTQIILDFAEQFIKRNTTRIKSNFSGLKAHSTRAAIMPEIVGLQNTRHEYIFIAERIKKIIATGVPAQEIAVLMTKNNDLATLNLYLQHLSIPTYIKRQQNLFEMPLVKQILLVMRYLHRESTDPYTGSQFLFQVLHLPFFGIAAHDIALACDDAKNTSKEYHFNLRKYLVARTTQTTVTQDEIVLSPKLLQVSMVLENLISDCASHNVYQVFRILVHQCQIHAYVLGHSHKIDLLDQLTTCFDFINECTSSEPDLSLAELMEQLDMMDSNEIKLPRTRAFGKDNGVQLLTLHTSKGLEYEHVIIAGNIGKNWEGKKGNNSGIKLPPNVLQEIELNKQGGDTTDDDIHELRRLLYVGMTRAKQYLTCTFARKDLQGKEIETSRFMSEAFGTQKNTEPAAEEQISEELLAYYEPVYINDEVTDVTLLTMEQSLVQKHLDYLTLSVTAINKYLRCHISYYYDKVLSVPSGINESMSFGSAIHRSFEYFFKEMATRGEWPSKDFLMECLEKSMWLERRNFSPKGKESLLVYGKELLGMHYDEFIDHWPTQSKIEWRPKSKIYYKNVPITGALDRIDFEGNTCEIVDYKTGNVDGESAKKKMLGVKTTKNGESTVGGDYWRQAVFYKILMNNCKEEQWHVRSAQFVFVEPSKISKKIVTKKVEVTDDDLAVVGQQIEDCYAGIMAREFTQGCGDATCAWCTFVKEQNDAKQ